jgi:hypothetical protein
MGKGVGEKKQRLVGSWNKATLDQALSRPNWRK